MIYSVEGFWEVKKNAYGEFTSVKSRGDLTMPVDSRDCSEMIFPEAVLVTTEDVESHQVLR